MVQLSLRLADIMASQSLLALLQVFKPKIIHTGQIVTDALSALFMS